MCLLSKQPSGKNLVWFEVIQLSLRFSSLALFGTWAREPSDGLPVPSPGLLCTTGGLALHPAFPRSPGSQRVWTGGGKGRKTWALEQRKTPATSPPSRLPTPYSGFLPTEDPSKEEILPLSPKPRKDTSFLPLPTSGSAPHLLSGFTAIASPAWAIPKFNSHSFLCNSETTLQKLFQLPRESYQSCKVPPSLPGVHGLPL